MIINEYLDGGLKMIDLFSFNKSLKTIWIKKYLDKTNMGKWKLSFDLELGRYGGKLCFWVTQTKKIRKTIFKLLINVTVHSGISSNGDYNNKTTEDNVWRNGGNTTPHSA